MWIRLLSFTTLACNITQIYTSIEYQKERMKLLVLGDDATPAQSSKCVKIYIKLYLLVSVASSSLFVSVYLNVYHFPCALWVFGLYFVLGVVVVFSLHFFYQRFPYLLLLLLRDMCAQFRINIFIPHIHLLVLDLSMVFGPTIWMWMVFTSASKCAHSISYNIHILHTTDYERYNVCVFSLAADPGQRRNKNQSEEDKNKERARERGKMKIFGTNIITIFRLQLP